MVHGPWSMHHGPWTMVHGPWTMDRKYAGAAGGKRYAGAAGGKKCLGASSVWAVRNVFAYGKR